MKKVSLYFVLMGMVTSGLLAGKKMKSEANVESLLEERFEMLRDYPVDRRGIPRSYSKETGEVRGGTSRDWTSGFFPGNLWLINRLTGDAAYAEKAEEWTALVEREQFSARDHDVGFRIGSSFGLGYQLTGNEAYKDVIIQSAKTLSTRYSDTVKSIRSWDMMKERWQFPVIIDNMMNLELLFEAAKLSGDQSFYDTAVAHADTTLENHFREDGSVYHVVDYDLSTGSVRQKNTHQGLSDDSAWARGQAWAVYGFTMTYRYTEDERYLDRAEKTARYFLEHPRLPDDGVPYWDFDDPQIPNAPKDVSAAAILCSALYELYGLTENAYYLEKADFLFGTLNSEKYILGESLDVPFLLDRSTGNYNKQSEVDGPISYGDYYFLEAMVRRREASES